VNVINNRLLAQDSITLPKVLCILFCVLSPAITLADQDLPTTGLAARIAALEAVDVQLGRASQRVAANDWAAAATLFEAVIGSSVFDSLPVARRHAIFTSASGVALQQQDYKLAQNYSMRACSMPNPTVVDWQVRLYASFSLPDMPDAAIALTQIARVWPDEFADVKDDLIFRILGELAKSTPPPAESFELMAALYEAHWKIGGFLEPSYTWRDYAIALVERGRLLEAKKVILRIKQPSVLISMRVDRRFAAIATSAPALFDIDKAVDANIATLRELCAQSPRSLRKFVELTYALLNARREEEVLALTESAIQKANDRSNGKSGYDDTNDDLIWVLNNRAIALGRVGRWDEKLELLIRAARRPEKGNLNVSQAINLGELYCELERPKDALFAVVDVQDTSPYGQLQLEGVRLCAALQLADLEAKEAALKYLKEHQLDSTKTYQGALIEVGDIDAAAMLLIERLRNPRSRSDVLVEIQTYNNPPALPYSAKLRERFQALLARQDVQQAVRKVGKIETFNVARALE